MKILHLESSPGWGGQEIRTFREALGMREKNHEVIIAAEKGCGLIERGRKEGLKVYSLRYKKIFWPITFFILMYIIIKNKIDIINTHSSSDAWLGGILGRILRRKIIRTRHLSTEIKGGLNSIILYNFLADFVVTTCGEVVDKIVKKSKLKLERCISIPTGVNIEAIKVDGNKIKQFKEKWHIEKNDFVIGTVCFIRSWKGIEDFLKAAKILEDKKDIKWFIIGGGHIEKYESLSKKMKLSNVYFTRHLEDPFAAMSCLDVFTLLSTDHEGVSQANLQAAFLKKPIIGTKTGGIKEVCIDGETGISVEKFSPQMVAAAAIKLFDDKALREKMGDTANKLVLEKFTYKKMLEDMQKVYDVLKA